MSLPTLKWSPSQPKKNCPCRAEIIIHDNHYPSRRFFLRIDRKTEENGTNRFVFWIKGPAGFSKECKSDQRSLKQAKKNARRALLKLIAIQPDYMI